MKSSVGNVTSPSGSVRNLVQKFENNADGSVNSPLSKCFNSQLEGNNIQGRALVKQRHDLKGITIRDDHLHKKQRDLDHCKKIVNIELTQNTSKLNSTKTVLRTTHVGNKGICPSTHSQFIGKLQPELLIDPQTQKQLSKGDNVSISSLDNNIGFTTDNVEPELILQTGNSTKKRELNHSEEYSEKLSATTPRKAILFKCEKSGIMEDEKTPCTSIFFQMNDEKLETCLSKKETKKKELNLQIQSDSANGFEGSIQAYCENSPDPPLSAKTRMKLRCDESQNDVETPTDDSSLIEQRKRLIQGLKRRLSEGIQYIHPVPERVKIRSNDLNQSLHGIDHEHLSLNMGLKKHNVNDVDFGIGFHTNSDKEKDEGSSFVTHGQENDFPTKLDDLEERPKDTSSNNARDNDLDHHFRHSIDAETENIMKQTKQSKRKRFTENPDQSCGVLNRFWRNVSKKNGILSKRYFSGNKTCEDVKDRLEKGVTQVRKTCCLKSLRRKSVQLVNWVRQICTRVSFRDSSISGDGGIFQFKINNIRNRSHTHLKKVQSFCRRRLSPLMKSTVSKMKSYTFKKSDIKRLFVIILKGSKMFFRFAVSSERGVQLTLSSLILSMSAEIYPTVPRHSTALSSLFFYTRSNQIDMNVGFFSVSAVVLFISTAIEVDYLISDYYPLKLRLRTDEIEYQFFQSSKFTRKLTWYCVAATSIIKIISFLDVTIQSSSSRPLLNTLRNKICLFIPPLFSQTPTDLDLNLESRFVALSWLQLIGSVTLVILAIYVHFNLAWSVHFSTVQYMLSLNLLMLLKSLTGVTFVIGVLRDSHLYDVFAEFGCSFLCMTCCKKYRRRSLENNGLLPPKVRIDKTMLKISSSLKLIDLLISVLLWPTLIWAHRLGGRYKSKEVRIILGIVSIILVVTDIMVPVHILVISSWYLQDYESRRGDTSERIASVEDDNCSDEVALQDYDLSCNVPTSQSVFEKRLASASSFQEGDDYFDSMDTLDLFVSCEPSEYNRLWNLLPKAVCTKYDLMSHYSMGELQTYFESRRFFTIASGVSNNSLIIFLLGQKNGIRCLVKTSINMKLHSVRQEFKSENPELTQFFIRSIGLQSNGTILTHLSSQT